MEANSIRVVKKENIFYFLLKTDCYNFISHPNSVLTIIIFKSQCPKLCFPYHQPTPRSSPSLFITMTLKASRMNNSHYRSKVTPFTNKNTPMQLLLKMTLMTKLKESGGLICFLRERRKGETIESISQWPKRQAFKPNSN